jgi:hypothetical protein
MVVYPSVGSGLFNIGCPFCFVTYTYPLLWGVIPAYAFSIALVAWSFLFKRAAVKLKTESSVSRLLSKALKVSIVFAFIGTLLLIAQMLIGPLGSG